MKKKFNLNEDIEEKIRKSIRTSTSPRHVPYKILEVEDIPRTLNGKKVEIAVKRLINYEKVENKDVLANPESLQNFKKILPILSQ